MVPIVKDVAEAQEYVHTVENENLMNPITRLSMPQFAEMLRSSTPEKSFKINDRYKNIIAEEIVNGLDNARVISKEE